MSSPLSPVVAYQVVPFQLPRADELHPLTKGSETGLGRPTDSTTLRSDILQVSIFAWCKTA